MGQLYISVLLYHICFCVFFAKSGQNPVILGPFLATATAACRVA